MTGQTASSDEEVDDDGTSDNAGSADGRALYWSSTEAAKLFLGSKHATEDVFDCLEENVPQNGLLTCT